MWQYDERTKKFIPGTLPADGSKISILYARLSQEDAQEGDSESITNQENICQGGFHPKDEISPIIQNLPTCHILFKLCSICLF